MFALTAQERRVIIFLLVVVLSGQGINFAMKLSPCIEKTIKTGYRFAKIDINKAGPDDFQVAKFISPKLAKKIIEYRRENGSFKSLEELKSVKGIGDYRYEKLKDFFYLE